MITASCVSSHETTNPFLKKGGAASLMTCTTSSLSSECWKSKGYHDEVIAIDEIVAATTARRATRRADAARPFRLAHRSHRRARLAEARDRPAHRLVQAPWRRQCHRPASRARSPDCAASSPLRPAITGRPSRTLRASWDCQRACTCRVRHPTPSAARSAASAPRRSKRRPTRTPNTAPTKTPDGRAHRTSRRTTMTT